MNFPGDLTTISASLNVQFTSVNRPPVFTENTTRVFVPKNTTVSSVVHRVIAVDDGAGANGRLNYRLLGTLKYLSYSEHRVQCSSFVFAYSDVSLNVY